MTAQTTEELAAQIEQQKPEEQQHEQVDEAVVEDDDDEDDEDEDDDDKDDDEVEGQEGDACGRSKQSRSEKKSRKAMLKLGMKPITGVSRVAVKKSKNVPPMVTMERGENDCCLEEEDIMEEEKGSHGSEVAIVESKKKRMHEDLDSVDKRGVCYLSRVPPHMNPSHIRQMLSNYGEVQRIYLVPEGQGHRKQACGSRAKAYSEGWVEFAKRSVAKRVASLLNGEQIGGKKRSSFYYDIWNIKYLRKFKWDDLVSEIAEKTHIREQKLNMEISAAKKQRDHYLSNAEKSRSLKFIHERRKKKQKTEGTGSNDVLETKVVRHIPQKQPVEETGMKTKSKLSKDILAGVFGTS